MQTDRQITDVKVHTRGSFDIIADRQTTNIRVHPHGSFGANFLETFKCDIMAYRQMNKINPRGSFGANFCSFSGSK